MNLYELTNNIKLTKSEQGILATIHIASSSSSAYDNINGSEQLIVAQKKLSSYGLIKIGDKQVKLTDSGRLELRRYNIIDDEGLTDNGKDIVISSSNNKKEWTTGR